MFIYSLATSLPLFYFYFMSSFIFSYLLLFLLYFLSFLTFIFIFIFIFIIIFISKLIAFSHSFSLSISTSVILFHSSLLISRTTHYLLIIEFNPIFNIFFIIRYRPCNRYPMYVHPYIPHLKSEYYLWKIHQLYKRYVRTNKVPNRK